ncbi:MAG: hypothetical protein C4538_04345 [Nitrospiraceae bacterium]|nr:MAG: hypothetical protein C4538_04345 [Nitrospiraceae bacterium]
MDTKADSDIKKDLIKILDCILRNVERKCDTCKECADVDVCCFITDAIIVYKHRGRKHTGSAL